MEVTIEKLLGLLGEANELIKEDAELDEHVKRRPEMYDEMTKIFESLKRCGSLEVSEEVHDKYMYVMKYISETLFTQGRISHSNLW